MSKRNQEKNWKLFENEAVYIILKYNPNHILLLKIITKMSEKKNFDWKSKHILKCYILNYTLLIS